MTETSKKTRIKDIARLSGVSTGTVDRVLHNRGEVSLKTRERILEIIKKLNFEPDILASTLAAKKKTVFAVIYPQPGHEAIFWKKPQEGIEKTEVEIKHYGVEVKKFPFDLSNEESFERQLKNALDIMPSGILLSPVFEKISLNYCEILDKNNIPYAFFNSKIDKANNIAYIGQDAQQSGYVAGKIMNLLMPANSTILIINISTPTSNYGHIEKRKQGFYQYYNEHKTLNWEIKEINIDTHKNIKELLNKELSKHVFQGIFTSNSRVYKVAEYLKSNNLEKIKLIGYDLLADSINYLKEDVIDCIISQKPFEQGALGLNALFQKVVLKKEIQKDQFLPIDIIMKENIKYYINQ